MKKILLLCVLTIAISCKEQSEKKKTLEIDTSKEMSNESMKESKDLVQYGACSSCSCPSWRPDSDNPDKCVNIRPPRRVLCQHGKAAHESELNAMSFTNSIVPTKENIEDLSFICINNGSSKDANFIGNGTGRPLTIRFTEANWSNIKNTCGNSVPANRTINGKHFTFPDGNLYQYQMVLFEDGPGVRNYFTGICREDENYTVYTKKGFRYYIYTNDTSGDHGDNDGYISFCYHFQ